jgi:thymidylate kinase
MNKLDTILVSLFAELRTCEVEYCILRNYHSIQDINNSDDLDLSVSIKHKSVVNNILNKLSWMSPDINLNQYGHQQYYKWNGNRLYKLDIIWGCYFANGKYRISEKDSIYMNCVQFHGMNIPDPNMGLRLMLLHVILDKGYISDKNKNQIINLMNKSSDSEVIEIAQYCVEQRVNRDSIKKLELELLNKGFILKNCKRLFTLKFIWKRIIVKFSKKKYRIAFIGVDGAGKSTVVKELKRYYQDKATTQYFGFKDYETVLAKKFTSDSLMKIKCLSPLLTVISIYIEMVCRYVRVMRSNEPLKIFDRYVWEAYDNAERKCPRIIYGLFFKVIFPKVDGIVYLYCPYDISLKRKDDIDDVNIFSKMKYRFDSIYINRKDVLSIDTNSNTIDLVLGKVVSYIYMVSGGRIL